MRPPASGVEPRDAAQDTEDRASGVPASAKGSEPPAASAPLDPSEEITPEELATIPEPVPNERVRGAPPSAARALWRVQIFASAIREEAGRVAEDASAKLGVPFVIDEESGLHKVRLGRFGAESEAESLRERAIDAGYYGAFRVHTSSPTIDDNSND